MDALNLGSDRQGEFRSWPRTQAGNRAEALMLFVKLTDDLDAHSGTEDMERIVKLGPNGDRS